MTLAPRVPTHPPHPHSPPASDRAPSPCPLSPPLASRQCPFSASACSTPNVLASALAVAGVSQVQLRRPEQTSWHDGVLQNTFRGSTKPGTEPVLGWRGLPFPCHPPPGRQQQLQQQLHSYPLHRCQCYLRGCRHLTTAHTTRDLLSPHAECCRGGQQSRGGDTRRAGHGDGPTTVTGPRRGGDLALWHHTAAASRPVQPSTRMRMTGR
jgi:hypothetical protein